MIQTVTIKHKSYRTGQISSFRWTPRELEKDWKDVRLLGLKAAFLALCCRAQVIHIEVLKDGT